MRRISFYIALALFSALLASVTSAQTVLNPSYEQVQIGPPFYSSDPADIPGWTHTGAHGDNWIWAVGAGGVTVAGAGRQFVTLGGGIGGPGTAYWTTTVTGLNSGNYMLRFKIANEGYAASQTITATLSGGANGTGSFTTTCTGPGLWGCWQQESLLFTVTGGAATLTFTNNQQYDIGLDDIKIVRVPNTGGTWSRVTSPPRSLTGAGATLLLTDGTVLVHSEQGNLSDWYTLTPDIYGSYVTGTWAQTDSIPASFGYAPLYFASAVLPDGRVIIEGGEYNLNNTNLVDTNLGAIYDPSQLPGSRWNPVASPPTWSNIGDAPSVVLPDGTFMLANCCNSEEVEMTAPYLGGSSWVPTGTFKHDWNNEEGWTLLPGPADSEVLLTVDTSVIFNSTCGSTGSELYINGYWFCTANTPTKLWDNTYQVGTQFFGHEMGPAVLRPDATVFQAGANGHDLGAPGQSAVFDAMAFQWTAGPTFTCTGCPNELNIADGPAALLPNGNVLMMTSPQEGYHTPSVFFELQLGTDTLVKAQSPPNAGTDSSFYGHMLVLPTGQILFTDFSSDVEIYTPTDTRVGRIWRPSVTKVNGVNCGSIFLCTYVVHTQSVNRIDGILFNGMSQGSAYGDDYQSATNYPLVRLREVQLCPPSGCTTPSRVYYCRTHDHSSMGVATGTLPVSTEFDCKGVPSGDYQMSVIANGVEGAVGGSILGVRVVQ